MGGIVEKKIKFIHTWQEWLKVGVLGQVVRVVYLESPLYVWIPSGTLDSLIWGSYPASLRNIDGSTQMPTRAWNNVHVYFQKWN